MELLFKDFDCYKHLSAEDLKSDYYKPDYNFNLARLPTVGLRDEFAAFIAERGNKLTYKSLYVDQRNYLLSAEFLLTKYPHLESVMDLDMETVELEMADWLLEKEICPWRKAKNGLTIHPAIRFLKLVSKYTKPKNYIYFRDLKCYKAVQGTVKNSYNYTPDSFFDLDLLPQSIISEFTVFIHARGRDLSYASIRDERMSYMYVAPFLKEFYPELKTFVEMDKDAIIRKFKAYLLKNGQALTYSDSRLLYENKRVKDNPAIRYLIRILEFFTPDDGLFHFEDDLWILDRLDFPVRSSSIRAVNSINFARIAQESMKEELKKSTLSRLREVKVSTVVQELHSAEFFTYYLADVYPQLSSFTEIDREIIESYLIYLFTEDKRRSNYRSEILHLKATLISIGRITEHYELTKLFFKDDIPKGNVPIYRFYTDKEIATLNEGFKTLDSQTGRLMILHELLGCRISETMTLRCDCIEEHEDGKLFIRIYEEKVDSTYTKPINREIKALLESSIEYTTNLYGPCEYIFVCDNDPSKPMQYSRLQYQLMRMIVENDLRDEHGDLFKVGTHIFRKTFGRRLCDMGLDDSVIAKLLGHHGTSAVKYYRQMSDKSLANETSQHMAQIDNKLKNLKGEWN